MSKEYYGYYESPIGIIEIKSTDEELLSVGFVQKQEKIKSEGIGIIVDTIKQLDEYFNGQRKSFDLKVKLVGTDFQKNAWTALMEIPYGETISYKEQAIKIGNEKAVRAVGGANGKNNIGIIIPCHRVIASNKKLTGYNGGIDKKKWLLEHEGKFK